MRGRDCPNSWQTTLGKVSTSGHVMGQVYDRLALQYLDIEKNMKAVMRIYKQFKGKASLLIYRVSFLLSTSFLPLLLLLTPACMYVCISPLTASLLTTLPSYSVHSLDLFARLPILYLSHITSPWRSPPLLTSCYTPASLCPLCPLCLQPPTCTTTPFAS